MCLPLRSGGWNSALAWGTKGTMSLFKAVLLGDSPLASRGSFSSGWTVCVCSGSERLYAEDDGGRERAIAKKQSKCHWMCDLRLASRPLWGYGESKHIWYLCKHSHKHTSCPPHPNFCRWASSPCKIWPIDLSGADWSKCTIHNLSPCS